MNIKEMEKFVGQLQRLRPIQFFMPTWIWHPGNRRNGFYWTIRNRFSRRKHECETVACLAGWYCLLNGGPTAVRRLPTSHEMNVERFAREGLGLTEDEAGDLFSGHWSHRADMTKITLREAIARLKRLIREEKAAACDGA